ncbi:RAB proteins geranylgeranyltransferase component A (RAB escort protein) [Pseudoloma neurophilia]|uniref:RAB proteins geranylgeranyltransferase component A (RAB escort protein) n=1 Tax=Pseudoloma neurophilia TaxID=146866 RepID=A0A0R0LVF0_9MICR|nr:RAB proteins geranylgeranyltransferase component A (RAB escort protein) [Pseudoloma neurophilia]
MLYKDVQNNKILQREDRNERKNDHSTTSSPESFDFVVLGTGLSESILAAVLAQSKYEVLQLESSDKYGSSLKTLNYVDFCAEYNQKPNDKLIGLSKEFNIDYTPKILLAGGLTQACVVNFDLSTILEFILIPGSYIFKNKLIEIPTSETKALRSSIIPFLQMPAVIKFFYQMRKYHQGGEITLKHTMREQFKHYGIRDEIGQMICHSIALFTDDSYLDMKPEIIYDKMKLYFNSLITNNSEESAFIYPLYGISDICQSFVRKAAIAGATTRVDCPVSRIVSLKNENVVIYDENIQKNVRRSLSEVSDLENNQLGNKLENMTVQQHNTTNNNFEITISPKNQPVEKIHARAIISTPLYFKKKIDSSPDSFKKIVRVTLIIEGPVPILKKHPSAHIFFLSSGLGRKNDVFALVLGHRERVAPKGYKVVLLSYKKEGQGDQPAQKLIHHFGKIVHSFSREEEIPIKQQSDVPFWYDLQGADESLHIENGIEEIVQMLETLKKDGFTVTSPFSTMKK